MNDTIWPNVLPRPNNQKLSQIKSISPWFQILQLNKHTYALLEPFHAEEVISYLILGEDRAILLDTGMGVANIQAEIEKLTQIPVIVVNSHSHYDHRGDNHRFDEVCVYNNEWEVGRLERGYSIDQCKEFMQPGMYLELPPEFEIAEYQIYPSSITKRLTHQEVIDLGKRSIIVHHTPGHSPGSICLQDTQYDLLFTGDTFYPGVLYAHFQESNLNDYIKSVHYLVGLADEIDHLCPAHNEAYVAKEFLFSVAEAFDHIKNNRKVKSDESNKTEYSFIGFSIKL